MEAHTQVKGHDGAYQMQASSPDSRCILGHDAGADEGHHRHSHQGGKGGRSLDCPWKLLVQPAATEHGKDHHLSVSSTACRSAKGTGLMPSASRRKVVLSIRDLAKAALAACPGHSAHGWLRMVRNARAATRHVVNYSHMPHEWLEQEHPGGLPALEMSFSRLCSSTCPMGTLHFCNGLWYELVALSLMQTVQHFSQSNPSLAWM